VANVIPFLGIITADGQTATNVLTGRQIALVDLQHFLEEVGFEGAVTDVFNTLDTEGKSIIGPPGPQGIPGQNAVSNVNGRGADDGSLIYDKNDLVVGSDRNSYLCLIDGTSGIDPVGDTTNWVVFVMQGAPGIQGIQGVEGPQGPPGKDAFYDNSQTPMKWPNDATVQNFADGSHGVRLAGTITTDANARDKKIIKTLPAGSHILDAGGYFEYNDGREFLIGAQGLNPAINPESVANSTIVIDNNSLEFYSTCSVNRSNAPFDVWVSYWTEGEV